MKPLKHLFFLLLPILIFSQNKPIKLHVLSVTSTDSIREERKFTIQYALENTTNEVVSFFLQPDKLFPAHSNAMGTTIFYKLYQEKEELLINGVFTTKKFYTLEGFPDFSKITNEKEREDAMQKFFEQKMKLKTDSVQKLIENGIPSQEAYKTNFSKSLMSSIFTLQPKETKTYSTVWYWDKKRYYKRDEFEYYLHEKSTFYIQFYLFLMKEQYEIKLTAADYEKVLKIPNFIKGVYQSEKVEINFGE